MRIWSIHPKYLDAKGLVALWRETLLAKHVLEGATKGYKNHPQLIRFKSQTDGLAALHGYLAEVFAEAEQRGYRFSPEKFQRPQTKIPSIVVQAGQVAYERAHLLEKLKQRAPMLYERWSEVPIWDVHPLFEVIDGGVADWERQ